MKVVVIGAGPAGCHVSSLLAREGHEVDLYEDHEKIGLPVQCTGIVSHAINHHIRLPTDCILNRIKGVRIHGPGISPLFLRFKKPNYILDRAAFDSHLADLARSKGVKIHLGKRLTTIENSTPIIEGKKIRSDMLIGADGPASTVAKQLGISRRSYWTGIQGIFECDHEDVIDFFPFIGTLAWKVPEGKHRVRVGVIARRDTKRIFERFSRNVMGVKVPIEIQGGIIPIYDKNIKTSFEKKMFLLGDAAGQVKASTGGGIIQGMQAGKILVRCIREKKDYDSVWKRELGPSLWAHLKMREVFDRFTPEDYTKLIIRFKKKKIKRILENVEREYPLKLASLLVLKDPALLTYLRFLL